MIENQKVANREYCPVQRICLAYASEVPDQIRCSKRQAVLGAPPSTPHCSSAQIWYALYSRVMGVE